MRIRALVIDDDPNWQKIISKMVVVNPLLELVGVCGSAMEGYGHLAEADIDLLICDIELPDMKGVDFIKSLRQSPPVIFVTSHADYALDCYEVAPIDFLLKGFSMERFLKSIERVRDRLLNPLLTPVIDPYFFVRDGQGYAQILYREVLYMKAFDNNLQIVTPTQTYTPVLSITRMEEKLKGDVFLRVHRSFLVHRSAIIYVNKDDLVLVNGETISIGEQYKASFLRKHVTGNLMSRNN